MNPQAHYSIAGSTRFRRIADQGVIIAQEPGEALVVNDTGMRILELIQDGLTLSGVAAAMAAEYGAPLADVTVDIESYLDEMLKAGVIEIAH